MFVISELEDNVEVRVALENKKEIILNKLNEKYAQKLVGDLGKAISIYNIVDIVDYKISCNLLITRVIFQVLFYRFYPEEICSGKIVSQDEDGIVIDDGIYRNYRAYPENIFENSEFLYDHSTEIGYWVWNYEDNKLIFHDGDIVRFRIREFDNDGYCVSVLMDEQGLGPCAWWD